MSSERFARIGELFDAVVDLPVGERSARLRALCDDVALRSEVEALLAADAAAGAFENAALGLRDQALVQVAAGGEPAESQVRFGPWVVVRELGRGGMGQVLLVERDRAAGFEQRGALKLIRRGLDSDAIVARFLRERRLLARLEHPHIARLLDGGVTEDERPWFVMEYVSGESLLSWCARRRSDLAERLRLFGAICDAAAFAHRALIVHRDIKPNNVMVTTDGQAKLLDFGIAKLVEPEPNDAGASTDAHAGPMTPAYASPEQLRGQPVSTVTDVYGLGAVLYELLCGQRPYDLGRDSSPVEWLKILDGPECKPPSAQVAAADPSVPPVSGALLRGDLDTIVLTALRRDPDRRYASVDALRDDLARFQRGLPIAARRDSLRYRAAKFVRRHRMGVALGALAGLALTISIAIALVQGQLAIREAQRTAAVQEFLERLFDASDPQSANNGYRMSARDLVTVGARGIDAEFSQEPELRARLSLVLGRILHRLGDTEAAIALLEREDGSEQAIDGHRLRDAQRWIALSEAHADLSKDESAESYALRVERRAAELGDLGLTSQALRLRAESARLRGDRQSALDLGRRAVAAAERGEQTMVLVDALVSLCDVLRETDQGEEAQRTAERAIAALDAGAHSSSLLSALARLELVAIFKNNGALGAADAQLAQARQVIEQRLPEDHPVRAEVFAIAGAIAGERGDSAAEVTGMRKAVEILERSLGNQNVLVAGHHSALALALSGAGDKTGALAEYQRAIAMFEALGVPDHPYALNALGNSANLMDQLGDRVGAEAAARAAIAASRRTLGPSAGGTLRRMFTLVTILRRHARGEEAAALAREALALQDANAGLPRNPRLIGLHASALAEASIGDFVRARSLLDRAIALCEAPPEVDHEALADSRLHYAGVLLQERDWTAAEGMSRQALTLVDQVYGDKRDWRPGFARLLLGEALAGLPGRRSEARALIQDAQRRLVDLEGAHSARARRAAASLAALN